MNGNEDCKMGVLLFCIGGTCSGRTREAGQVVAGERIQFHHDSHVRMPIAVGDTYRLDSALL